MQIRGAQLDWSCRYHLDVPLTILVLGEGFPLLRSSLYCDRYKLAAVSEGSHPAGTNGFTSGWVRRMAVDSPR